MVRVHAGNICRPHDSAVPLVTILPLCVYLPAVLLSSLSSSSSLLSLYIGTNQLNRLLVPLTELSVFDVSVIINYGKIYFIENIILIS
jgi:hypothetical protein